MDKFKNKFPASYWIASTEETSYPSLDKDIEIDIAIIGGGIVGIMTGYMLTKAGHKVTIFDKDRIITSTTGHTTAKITSQHGLFYHNLIDSKGIDAAKTYAESQEWAVKYIKDIIAEHEIKCDFEEQSAYVFTQDASYIESIKNEVDAAKNLGINAHFIKELDLPFKTLGAVKFKNQGQFHPRKYLLTIADYIIENGGQIYENTLIKDIDRGDKNTLTTRDKNRIAAKKVIVASQYPFTDTIGFYFARVYQERSYIIAAKIKEDYPNGMYISAENPTRSIRTHRDGNNKYLLIAGQKHKTGHDEHRAHYDNLYNFASKYYTVDEIPYYWSAQDVHTTDNIPYIGRITKNTENVYVATGFKKWGMTNAHVAAKIISDLIIKGENPWSKLYSPYRSVDGLSILKLVEQNLQVAKDLIRGKTKEAPKDYDLNLGEGKVVEINGEKIGAYVHEDGKVYFVDTTCTHLGCELIFNHVEKSWDCPCHGSRFDYKGKIIHGPATRNLK